MFQEVKSTNYVMKKSEIQWGDSEGHRHLSPNKPTLTWGWAQSLCQDEGEALTSGGRPNLCTHTLAHIPPHMYTHKLQ